MGALSIGYTKRKGLEGDAQVKTEEGTLLQTEISCQDKSKEHIVDVPGTDGHTRLPGDEEVPVTFLGTVIAGIRPYFIYRIVTQELVSEQQEPATFSNRDVVPAVSIERNRIDRCRISVISPHTVTSTNSECLIPFPES